MKSFIILTLIILSTIPVTIGYGMTSLSSSYELGAPTTDDLGQSMETHQNLILKWLVEKVIGRDPVKAYLYVKNHILYEPFWGISRSAVSVYTEKYGNALEQSSLLITLLRIMDVPARYVIGRVNLTREDLGKWLGVDSSTALKIFREKRLVYRIYDDMDLVEIYHAWVVAYINNSWVMMDPSYKEQIVRSPPTLENIPDKLLIPIDEAITDYLGALANISQRMFGSGEVIARKYVSLEGPPGEYVVDNIYSHLPDQFIWKIYLSFKKFRWSSSKPSGFSSEYTTPIPIPLPLAREYGVYIRSVFSMRIREILDSYENGLFDEDLDLRKIYSMIQVLVGDTVIAEIGFYPILENSIPSTIYTYVPVPGGGIVTSKKDFLTPTLGYMHVFADNGKMYLSGVEYDKLYLAFTNYLAKIRSDYARGLFTRMEANLAIGRLASLQSRLYVQQLHQILRRSLPGVYYYMSEEPLYVFSYAFSIRAYTRSDRSGYELAVTPPMIDIRGGMPRVSTGNETLDILYNTLIGSIMGNIEGLTSWSLYGATAVNPYVVLEQAIKIGIPVLVINKTNIRIQMNVLQDNGYPKDFLDYLLKKIYLLSLRGEVSIVIPSKPVPISTIVVYATNSTDKPPSFTGLDRVIAYLILVREIDPSTGEYVSAFVGSEIWVPSTSYRGGSATGFLEERMRWFKIWADILYSRSDALIRVYAAENILSIEAEVNEYYSEKLFNDLLEYQKTDLLSIYRYKELYMKEGKIPFFIDDNGLMMSPEEVREYLTRDLELPEDVVEFYVDIQKRFISGLSTGLVVLPDGTELELKLAIIRTTEDSEDIVKEYNAWERDKAVAKLKIMGEGYELSYVVSVKKSPGPIARALNAFGEWWSKGGPFQIIDKLFGEPIKRSSIGDYARTRDMILNSRELGGPGAGAVIDPPFLSLGIIDRYGGYTGYLPWIDRVFYSFGDGYYYTGNSSLPGMLKLSNLDNGTYTLVLYGTNPVGTHYTLYIDSYLGTSKSRKTINGYIGYRELKVVDIRVSSGRVIGVSNPRDGAVAVIDDLGKVYAGEELIVEGRVYIGVFDKTGLAGQGVSVDIYVSSDGITWDYVGEAVTRDNGVFSYRLLFDEAGVYYVKTLPRVAGVYSIPVVKVVSVLAPLTINVSSIQQYAGVGENIVLSIIPEGSSASITFNITREDLVKEEIKLDLPSGSYRVVVAVYNESKEIAFSEKEVFLVKNTTVEIPPPQVPIVLDTIYFGKIELSSRYGEIVKLPMPNQTIIQVDDMTRLVFKGWLLNGRIVDEVNATQSLHLEALWEKQYLVILPEELGGSRYVSEGSVIEIDAAAEKILDNGTILVFQYWVDKLTNEIISYEPKIAITVDKPYILEPIYQAKTTTTEKPTTPPTPTTVEETTTATETTSPVVTGTQTTPAYTPTPTTPSKEHPLQQIIPYIIIAAITLTIITLLYIKKYRKSQ